MTPHTNDAARAALKAAALYTDDQPYELIQLPPRAITAAASVLAEVGEAFAALIADKDEVTLVLPAGAAADFTRRLPGLVISSTTYRLITFDAVLEPTLTGFMALISRALADAGIPILPLAAYSRDHILVPADHLEAALTALRTLQSS